MLREGEAAAGATAGGVEGTGTEGMELGCVLFEEWWRRWLGVVKGPEEAGGSS